MDRNQATGLILIALLVILYFQFFAPKTPEPKDNKQTTTEQTTTDSTENVAEVEDTTSVQINDSLVNEEMKQKYGVFAAGTHGEEQQLTIQNEDLEMVFTNKGAVPSQVTLKKFKNNMGAPLVLFNENSNRFKLIANTSTRQVDLHQLYYEASKSTVNDTTVLTYTLNLGEGRTIKHIYSIPKSGYQVGYNLELEGLNNSITKDQLVFEWDDKMIAQEKDISLSRRNSTINYYTSKDGFDNLSERTTKPEEASVEGGIKWVSLKQRFFVAAIVAENSFSKGKFNTSIDESDSSVVKDAKVVLGIPLADASSGKGQYKYFFGPNDYYLLGTVTEGFSQNLALGWPPMKWVNKYVIIPLFNFLSSFIGSYGLIIMIMVLIIKLALSPLSYKSYVSMAKMKVLKPQLDEIKEKHDGDMSKAQQEQMKLYQKVGVNPVSGCIPMLLQMPILLSMFYFFPQSIELRQESFLWATDLSTYDSILNLPFNIPFYGDHVSLFVLLMTMSTILMTYSQQQVSTVQGPMKAFSYMMPLIFMFVLNSYPAALSFYYFISNLVTFGQQTLIRKFIDEDKIKQVLEENRKRNANKKKSKFQVKLEDAMKAQDKNKKKK